MAWWSGLVPLLIFLAGSQLLVSCDDTDLSPDNVRWVRFIVTVNDTWDPDGCIATIATGKLAPNKKSNETKPITVGSCDHGPLVYTVTPGQAPDKMSVDLTFHSSSIEDAAPPTCQIPWNGTYVSPRARPDTDPRDDSPLPGCFTIDSREGHSTTFYWFYLLDWAGAGAGHCDRGKG